MLNYGEGLEHMRANQLVTCLYLYLMTIGNRQSSKGFNSNSPQGEAYHQLFMLQTKEQIQILIDNNIFFRIDLFTVLTAFLTKAKCKVRTLFFFFL